MVLNQPYRNIMTLKYVGMLTENPRMIGYIKSLNSNFPHY